MLQVKILQEAKMDGLNTSINDFLATVNSKDVKDIKYELSNIPLIAIIQYELVEPWQNELCCDCKYWDDGDSTSSVTGLCFEHGLRKRFNCKACKEWKDRRG